MNYAKQFDLEQTRVPAGAPASAAQVADRSDGLVYLYTPEIELTINVALATGRPVLLRGPSGSGKSSLAKNVALRMKRRYYEEVVTSNTQHTDLLYRYDLLRRFRDANEQQGAGLKHDAHYLEPRALWWAFDKASAERRGRKEGETGGETATDPSLIKSSDGAVVLIDEIDKADPDVPNNLLVALGGLRFPVPYLNDVTITAVSAPLVLITSNDERDLPTAFLRRCIVLELQPADAARMVDIAKAHFGDAPDQVTLYEAVAALAFPAVKPGEAARDKPPSTAEYLDAVQSCAVLKVRPSDQDEVWHAVARATLRKASQSDRSTR